MNMDVDVDGFLGQNGTYDYDDDYEYKEEIEARVEEAILEFSDIFILHLSVSDLLLLVSLPLWAAEAAQISGWCCGGFLCKISGAVFNINFYCGMFLLLCISLDCYLSIVHSTQRFSQKNPRSAHICCLSVWLLSVIFSIPDWIFLSVNTDTGKRLCNSYAQSISTSQLVSRLLHLTLGFLLPSLALIICSSFILLRLKRGSECPQKKRAGRLLLPLVVVFFLCWMPYHIILFVDTIRRSSKERDGGLYRNLKSSQITALMFTSAVGCLHACLRPLLYFGLCGNFRERTLAMLTCATVNSNGSLWELGVGEEALPEQNHEEEELKQMTETDDCRSAGAVHSLLKDGQNAPCDSEVTNIAPPLRGI
ncbi:C-X-C chemokine receptor type 3 [Dissostichus eleginoides]|uniref:C-X-C chemokine receptor type 3 n=1 Tax=Dissostichus eleginoides TaxID=100907 RepID=A0AAD9FB67_DISEL|nr:C-X-C chemokine receptor type 3 [Dissostichus eleginoides]